LEKKKVKTFFKNFFYYWLPVLIWAALIFFLSSRSGLKVATGTWDFLTRKPVHIFEYFVLTLLLVRAFKFEFEARKNELFSPSSKKSVNLMQKNNNFYVLSFSFLASLLYAVSDEIHQSFVPLREGKISDILFDSVGSLVGIFLVWKLFQNRQNKPKK